MANTRAITEITPGMPKRLRSGESIEISSPCPVSPSAGPLPLAAL
jgi:hypothetical protein